jgi:hypothetical protein
MDASKIEVSSFTAVVECPYCHTTIDGWLGDPRGADDVECEDCQQKFNIPSNCEVVLL